MTVHELITELRKCPKYWTVAYDYERHYIFYIYTIINNYNKSIILSCDVGNTNVFTVRQLASKLLKYDLNMPIKVGHRHAYQVDEVKILHDLVLITTKW